MRDVGAQLGFPSSVIASPVGVGGGLVIFHKSLVQLSVVSQSAHLIDCKVVFNGMEYYFSYVYGHPDTSQTLLMGKTNKTKLNQKTTGLVSSWGL